LVEIRQREDFLFTFFGSFIAQDYGKGNLLSPLERVEEMVHCGVKCPLSTAGKVNVQNFYSEGLKAVDHDAV
jgi:hypothetical protein